MRFNALMDTRTKRVESVVLSSDTFGDEKLLTAIIEAFEHPLLTSASLCIATNSSPFGERPSPMDNAVIYARYSPRPPKDGEAERVAADEDAETIRLQIDVCNRYAKMKDLLVFDHIKDCETSARKTPMFEREGGSVSSSCLAARM